jgi:Family of unknown function (DUF6868)
MELQTLTTFFGWTVVINFALYIITVVFILLMPDLSYKIMSKFFSIKREDYNKEIFGYLSRFKILTIIFSFVPYLALIMMR